MYDRKRIIEILTKPDNEVTKSDLSYYLKAIQEQTKIDDQKHGGYDKDSHETLNIVTKDYQENMKARKRLVKEDQKLKHDKAINRKLHAQNRELDKKIAKLQVKQ